MVLPTLLISILATLTEQLFLGVLLLEAKLQNIVGKITFFGDYYWYGKERGNKKR